MKTLFSLAGALVAGLFLFSGCANIEIKPPGDADRVLSGKVGYPAEDTLPAGAVLTVRLLDQSNPGTPAMVVGEQTIKDPGASPVAFRIEYHADDTLLRHGLNLEARIAVGGRLQFYNVTSYAVTLGNAGDPHTIWVDRARK